MKTAERKKQDNIAEYIIHMYQTQDLIRAFDFDIEQIRTYVIKHFPESEGVKEEIVTWYESIIDKMKVQGLEKNGHLIELKKLVEHLEQLKTKLLEKDDEFKNTYKNALPYIKEALAAANGLIDSEIQICLNGVYGLLLAKLNGREVPEEIKVNLEHYGNVLSYLSYKYKQQEYLSSN